MGLSTTYFFEYSSAFNANERGRLCVLNVVRLRAWDSPGEAMMSPHGNRMDSHTARRLP